MYSQVAPDRVFDVIEHVIPAQHVRGYPHSAKDPSAVLRLAVKQYVPTCNVDSAEDGVTIIAAHANGIVKVRWRLLQAGYPTMLTGEGNVRTTMGGTEYKIEGSDQSNLDCRL
jgi:hypothetical protein